MCTGALAAALAQSDPNYCEDEASRYFNLYGAIPYGDVKVTFMYTNFYNSTLQGSAELNVGCDFDENQLGNRGLPMVPGTILSVTEPL